MDSVSMSYREDLLWTTIGKYEMFLSYGRDGIEAMNVYIHLMYTAKLQGTNSVYANDIYIRNGIHIGSDKLSKAKALLYKMGLIKTIDRRDENGKIVGKYIEVTTKTVPFEGETPQHLPECYGPQHSKPRSGLQETNALTNNNKCLNKENIYKAPCTIEEVIAYCKEMGYEHTDPQAFMDHYTLTGWTYGKTKTKIKDWKAAVRGWERRTREWDRDKKLKSKEPRTFRERNPYLESIERLVEDGDAIITDDGQIEMVNTKLLEQH